MYSFLHSIYKPSKCGNHNCNYNGDNTHQASTGSSQLTTNVLHPTTASITPNPGTFTAGTPITFTVTISDTSEPTSTMIGIVKWTDNGAGGSFSPDACIISNNHCSLDYTPPSNPSGSITITAFYAGDSTHSASSATSSVSTNTATSAPSTSQSNTSPPESATQSSPTKPAPTTQPSTPPPTTQQTTKLSTPITQPNTSPTTTQQTTKPNTSPTTQTTNTSPSTTTQSTTQSNTHSTAQTDSKNPTTSTTINTNTNHQQVNPLATISQAISKAVSELESLFQRL